MADILLPFVAGQKDTADAHNDAHDLRREKFQSGDQSVSNSTTLVSSTYMTFAVDADISYFFELFIFFDANTTADLKLGLLLPAGAGIRWVDEAGNSSTSVTRVYQGVAAGTVPGVNPWGWLDMAGSAGSFTVQFAQNALSATNPTILKAGSMARLTQVSV